MTGRWEIGGWRLADSPTAGVERAPALFFAALPMLMLWVACGGPPEFGPGVAARIDGSDVPYEEFERYVTEATGEEASKHDSAVLRALFDQYLEQELLLRLAEERKLLTSDASPGEAALRLLEESPFVPPTSQEIVDYYRDHSADFERGERILLRQVLAQDQGTADAIKSDLAAGVSFAEMAARFAEDERAVFVGERGELQRNELPIAFVEPIFALEAGETSAVLEADYGFHVFQVVAKSEAGLLPFADVEHTIRQRLERDRATAKLADLVAHARSRYNLAVAERNLPFALGAPE